MIGETARFIPLGEWRGGPYGDVRDRVHGLREDGEGVRGTQRRLLQDHGSGMTVPLCCRCSSGSPCIGSHTSATGFGRPCTGHPELSRLQ